MPLTPTLADFNGPAQAQFLLARNAVRVAGEQPGQVNTVQNITVTVGDGGGTAYASDAQWWDQLLQLNSIPTDGIAGHPGSGQPNVAGYDQLVNTAGRATNIVHVFQGVQGDPTDSSTMALLEGDAQGHVQVGFDMISFPSLGQQGGGSPGQLDIAYRALGANGGKVGTGFETDAAMTLVDFNPADHLIYANPIKNVGLVVVGQGDSAHLDAVIAGHVTVLAHA